MTPPSGTPLSRSAFLAAAAGLLLAACGGSGEDAALPAAADTAVADTTVPDTPVPDTAVPDTPVPDTAVPDTTVPDTTVADTDTAGVSVVPAALIGATTIHGTPFDAAVLAGRPTVAWFWAPWCVICRGEAPDVAEIAARHAGRVNVIGAAGRSEVPDMVDFVSDTSTMGFPHLDDSSGEIWAAYEIYAQPAFAFITDDGRLETFVGSLGADTLAETIDELIVA